MHEPMEIHLYTDGSCHNGGDKSGGWAWIVLKPIGGTEESSGQCLNTTSNRMEQMALIDGLASIWGRFGPSKVLVHSDSKYVIGGCENRHWKRNVNKDLWSLLDDVINLHDKVEFVHVKGHSGNKYNEQVDDLAGLARKGKVLESTWKNGK